MRAMNGNTSNRVVTDDGVVIVGGHRQGKVIRLRTGRWIFARPGGEFTSKSWPNQEEAIDALLSTPPPKKDTP
ncbi:MULTISPECIES: hypothetical protein [unclassified Aeromicrobium]|uniref:hypothetical protein n=1 Tax=unclassified Aeromicrobium TaxID=2633570 RepID=UPI00288BE95D|nr:MULTISPECIES: hypothetical protein [unclassified Aeromicrobium]